MRRIVALLTLGHPRRPIRDVAAAGSARARPKWEGDKLESGTIAAPQTGAPSGAREGDKGLKAGAIGYISNLVIGVLVVRP